MAQMRLRFRHPSPTCHHTFIGYALRLSSPKSATTGQTRPSGGSGGVYYDYNSSNGGDAGPIRGTASNGQAPSGGTGATAATGGAPFAG